MTSQASPPHVRGREAFEQLLSLLASEVAVGWTWAVGAVSPRTAGVAGALVLFLFPLLVRRRSWFRAFRYVLPIVLLGFLVHFYGDGFSRRLFGRTQNTRGVFAASVALAGSYLLWRGLPPLAAALRALGRRLSGGAEGIAVGVGWALVLALTVDLFFVGTQKQAHVPGPRYHPWAAFWWEDCYLTSHAREGVVKDLRGTSFAQKKPEGVTRIVLTGASTMWGLHLSDSDAPAGQLKKALEQRYPHRKFEVLAIAAPGKYQLNELVDAAVTIPHWSPDLVVSWNGFNEIWYGEEKDRYEGMPFIAMQLEGVLAAPPWLAAGSRTPSYALGAAYARATDGYRSPYALKAPVEYEPPRYYAYLAETARILKSFKIPYLHSFCPNVAEKVARTPAEDKRILNDWARQVPERRARSREIVLAEGQMSYDVMDGLRNQPEELFDDPCHLTATGARLAMADLAGRLKPLFGEK